MSPLLDIERLTQADLARVFGITRAAVAQWDAPRNLDGSYDLRAVIAWRLAKVTAAARIRSVKELDADEQLARMRSAKAGLAELELAQKRGAVVSREDLRISLLAIATHLKRFGEQLQRRFGHDAAKLFNDCLDGFERTAKGALEKRDTAERSNGRRRSKGQRASKPRTRRPR